MTTDRWIASPQQYSIWGRSLDTKAGSNAALEMAEFYGKVFLSSSDGYVAFFWPDNGSCPVVYQWSFVLKEKKQNKPLSSYVKLMLLVFRKYYSYVLYVSALFFRCSCVMLLNFQSHNLFFFFFKSPFSLCIAVLRFQFSSFSTWYFCSQFWIVIEG